MPSELRFIPATVFRDGTPQRLNEEQEQLKREIYERMNPRRRKFVDRIGYDNWDPFQKPSSRPPGTNSTATTTVAACWNALWVL